MTIPTEFRGRVPEILVDSVDILHGVYDEYQEALSLQYLSTQLSGQIFEFVYGKQKTDEEISGIMQGIPADNKRLETFLYGLLPRISGKLNRENETRGYFAGEIINSLDIVQNPVSTIRSGEVLESSTLNGDFLPLELRPLRDTDFVYVTTSQGPRSTSKTHPSDVININLMPTEKLAQRLLRNLNGLM